MAEKVASETPVVVTVPATPPKAKESNDGTHQLAVKVCGVVMVTGLLIGGFLGTVYFLSHNNSDGNQNSAKESEEVFHNVKEVQTQYELKGKTVTELFHLDMDSKIVEVDDFADNFKVVLDYRRNLAVFKNLTSSTCYFTNLEDVPIDNPFNAEEDKPRTSNVIFMPLSNDSQKVDAPKIVTMQNLLELPRDYVTRTNSKEVSGMCSSSKSFWISLEDDDALQGSTRTKRLATRPTCSCDCCVYYNGALTYCGSCPVLIIIVER